ncbi:MAG: ABC transporter ATP-binding protein [Ardenticatenia bacterium]|nr:ABC transporter ATP-binding protein [Ardenticatenia bacterium]
MIALSHVSKVYRMGSVDVQALGDVSLTIPSGEWLAITGSSGGGKSTLMNVIGCLDTPDSGSYRLNGQEVADLSENALADIRNREIGFVYQTFNLLARMPALKQVMLPMQYVRSEARLPLAERRDRAASVLQAVGLGDRLNHDPSELSGGQRQRVAIARALINEPRIILADEPTGNLDTRAGEEILEIFSRLHRESGVTLIMVTHEEPVADMAQRIVRMRDGRIVEELRR